MWFAYHCKMKTELECDSVFTNVSMRWHGWLSLFQPFCLLARVWSWREENFPFVSVPNFHILSLFIYFIFPLGQKPWHGSPSPDLLLQPLSPNIGVCSIYPLVVLPHHSASFSKVHLLGPLSNLFCSWLELWANTQHDFTHPLKTLVCSYITLAHNILCPPLVK